MIKSKEAVYEWFRNLDSATRIEFICSIIHLCHPAELRLLGSCLEHTARKHYHKLKEFELKANDHGELTSLTERMQEESQYKSQELRSKLIFCLCLLSSKPNALCTRAVFQLLSVVDKLLRISDLCSPMDEKLVEDFRLLLTIAIHHPAFTFNQRQQLISQMETFRQIFGTPVPPTCHMTSSQCQTDDDLFVLPQSQPQCQEDKTNRAHTQSCRPEVTAAVHISELTLISTERTSRNELHYTIQVDTMEGKSHSVRKTFSEICRFHSALLAYFPDDAKAPKTVRNIPLMGPTPKGSGEVSAVRDYLSGLCKMCSKYLNSEPVRDFLDLSSTGEGDSHLPVNLCVTASPSCVVTQSVMVNSGDGTSTSSKHLRSKQSSPISVSSLQSNNSTAASTPPPQLQTTEQEPSSESRLNSQVGLNHALMSSGSRSHSQRRHSPSKSSSSPVLNHSGQPPNQPITSQNQPLNHLTTSQSQPLNHPITSQNQPHNPPVISKSPLPNQLVTLHSRPHNHPITSQSQPTNKPITSQSMSHHHPISSHSHEQSFTSQVATSAKPPHSVPTGAHLPRYKSAMNPQPHSPLQAPPVKANLSSGRSGPASVSPHASVYSFLKLLRLHKYASHLRNISMEELLLMSKDDLRKQGLVEGAAKKLADELEKENIKRKIAAARRAEVVMSRSDSSGMLASDRLDRLDRSQQHSDSSNSDKSSLNTSPTVNQPTPPPIIGRSPSDTDLAQAMSQNQRVDSPAMLNHFSDMSISSHKSGVGNAVSSSPDTVHSDQSSYSIEVSVLPDSLVQDPSIHHTTITTSYPSQPPLPVEPVLVPALPPGFVSVYNPTLPPPPNKPPHLSSQPDSPYPVTNDMPNHPHSQQQQQIVPVVISNPTVPLVRDNSNINTYTVPSVLSPQANSAPPPLVNRGPVRSASRESLARANVGGMRPKDGVRTVEDVQQQQQEVKAAQQRLNYISPPAPAPQPLALPQKQLLIRNPAVIENDGSQPKLHQLPQNSLVVTASRNTQPVPPVLSNHMSASGYSSRRDSDDATELSDGRESIYSYSNRDPDDIEYMSERYDECDVSHTREPVTGAPIFINSQSVPIHMQQSIDGDFSYIPPPVNGFKQPSSVIFHSPADLERITLVPHADAMNFSQPCPCASCSMPPYLLPASGIHHQAPAGPPPPGTVPPPPPPAGQNGFISHAGFIPAGFVPTSNGLISPDMPPFSRRPPINNSGAPLLARADVMYHPVGFMVPPTRPPYQPSFYAPPTAKRFYCSNCGDSSHTNVDCREPPDNSELIST